MDTQPIEKQPLTLKSKERRIDENHKIDIKGIPKVLLLQHLWENTSPPGDLKFIWKFLTTIPFNKHIAEKGIKRDLDYYQGRPIKCDISGDTAYTKLYDRDSSKSFKDIVNDIREEIRNKKSKKYLMISVK